jgi:acyl-CoA thioester hydrolase
MKSGETSVRVRYEETDQMGVVYYANYFVWFEVGRTEYFRTLGMPYYEFERNDIYLPVTRAFAHYKAPARYDEVIRVVTDITNIQEVRMGLNTRYSGKMNCLFSGKPNMPLLIRLESL